MIKEKISLGAICVVWTIASMARASQAQDTPTSQKLTPNACEALLSKDKSERANAAQTIVASQGELVNCLLRQLKAEIRKPDREFGGSFSQLLWVLGKLRVTPAVGDLVSVIDMSLTGIPPVGGFGGSEVYYPVAGALADIGGPDLSNAIFYRLSKPTKDSLLRVSTWVLVKAYSEPVTRSIIQVRLAEVSAVLKNIGVSDTNPEKKNLERMKELLDSKEPLLPDPETSGPFKSGNTNNAAPTAGPFGGAVGDKK